MSITRRELIKAAGIGVAGAVVGGVGGIALNSGPGWLLGSELPRALPVDTDTDIPAEADVVVVGAGIAGISTALFLQQKGLKTVVFEKGRVAGEQSSRAFGWVYTNGWHPEKLELAVLSKQIWQDFAGQHGIDVGWRQSGNTFFLKNEQEVAQAQAWIDEARRRFPDDIDARLLRGAELEAFYPGAAANGYIAAQHQPSDGTGEPAWSVPLMASAARAAGVKIIAPVAVRGIETQGGQVSHVVTERGVVRASRVVVAGGAWSRLFAGNLGVKLPQLGIASPLQRLSAVNGLPGGGAGTDFAWRRHADGEYTLGVQRHIAPVTLDSFKLMLDFLPALRHTGDLLKVRFGRDFFESLRLPTRWRNDEVTPFEQVRMLTARVPRKEADEFLANAERAVPAFGQARVLERWGGVIDATPDSTPVISEVPALPGLFLNTGFSGGGFTLGTGAGRMLAEIIAGEQPSADPSIYRFSRFSDGSELSLRH
ncbi:NAD(P)/FAD-dependent oxidoreductase [Shewanella xiamenensis]|uniref:NAD(P)/FAD-dependent oxidoreductase n=1 Tax=Shewanella xiamenensis TaxID=332186 RepID=UPI001CC53B4F|nr:FAD-binding oxidoreductase [Shewanella xiamenensis]BDA61770.1 D-amino-acid oxidase [Shewanella xiamenensis]